jgi:TetR/AcrR family transcriptional repressor of nem operon
MNAKQDKTVELAILDVAQELVQRNGYNAFSYRDLSNRVGVKTSSIHYYFPSKADLGRVLVQRYTEQLKQVLAAIDAATDNPCHKLERLAGIFSDTFRADGRLCLGGMLATDFMTLPETIQTEVRVFFTSAETWLTQVLEAGRSANAFQFHGSPEALAKTYIATLEGALIAARAFNDERRLTDAATWLQMMLTEAKA